MSTDILCLIHRNPLQPLFYAIDKTFWEKLALTYPWYFIVINDEGTPLIARQSRDFGNHCIELSLLTPPTLTNEDIISVLICQKDIIPVLGDMLGIIGRRATHYLLPLSPTSPTSSFFSRNDPSKQPPIKKRKLDRVPADATDWDVPPFPF